MEDDYLKQLNDVESEFRERLRERESAPRDYYNLWEYAFYDLRKKALEKRLDVSEYMERISEADDIILDIAYAMRANWSNVPQDRGNVSPLDEMPHGALDPSPINKDMLDEATAKYLSKTWMQSNYLDSQILRSFIRADLIQITHAIRSGEALTGRPSLAYTLADGRVDKIFLYQIGFSLLRGFLRWLLFPLICITLYFLGYTQVMTFLLVPYVVYISIHILLFPKRYIGRRQIKRRLEEFLTKLGKINNVYNYCCSKTINPTNLRKQLEELESQGIFIMPAVLSIVDRAIQRDPAVFISCESEI